MTGLFGALALALSTASLWLLATRDSRHPRTTRKPPRPLQARARSIVWGLVVLPGAVLFAWGKVAPAAVWLGALCIVGWLICLVMASRFFQRFSHSSSTSEDANH